MADRAIAGDSGIDEPDGAMAGDCAVMDPECAMPAESAIDDMACSAAGSGSLTALSMISASGLNRYHSAAPATMALPKSMDLRVVMLHPLSCVG
ncbi:MAG: hypothetical protein AUH12_04715 [Gemmatimonadetes bacterium 13_2_20CM_69_8]|nr:MAG: hypothetical protein AUH12_04715 [Gemmatimonadetes bacterium 13_2_20CM_69_8]